MSGGPIKARTVKPWTVTATRRVLRDRWIDVRADDCVTADGAVVAPYYVIQPAAWVHVLAIDARDHAIMVRHYRHGLGGLSLELPGGALDAEDASPAAGALRELREETGYECGSLKLVGTFSPNPASHANMMHVFVAREARLVSAATLEPGETLVVERVPVAELRRLALGGGIVHGLHVAAVLMGLEMLT